MCYDMMGLLLAFLSGASMGTQQDGSLDVMRIVSGLPELHKLMKIL